MVGLLASMDERTPSDPNAAHLSGIQPTWRNLAFTAAVLQVIWHSPEGPWETINARLREATGQSKIDDNVSLLKKLDFIDVEHRLTPSGVILAENYSPPPTTSGTDGVELDDKVRLSDIEQTVFQKQLFEYDWLPMLAVLNQVSTERVPPFVHQTRASSFVNRLSHLADYDADWSPDTKMQKARTHFNWARDLELTSINDEEHLELTPRGKATNDRLRHLHHPEWDQPSEQRSLDDVD